MLDKRDEWIFHKSTEVLPKSEALGSPDLSGQSPKVGIHPKQDGLFRMRSLNPQSSKVRWQTETAHAVSVQIF